MQFFDQIKQYIPKIEIKWIDALAVSKIIDKLMLFDQKTSFKIQEFSKTLPSELQPILDETYLLDLSRVEDPGKEWERVLFEIQGMYVRAELKKLAAEIAEAEKKGEVIDALQARFVDLSKSLNSPK